MEAVAARNREEKDANQEEPETADLAHGADRQRQEAERPGLKTDIETRRLESVKYSHGNSNQQENHPEENVEE